MRGSVIVVNRFANFLKTPMTVCGTIAVVVFGPVMVFVDARSERHSA